jgi:hypothetical protein
LVFPDSFQPLKNIAMGWPQITLLILVAFNIGIAATNHGKPRSNYSILWSLIDAAILLWLLTMRGFSADLSFTLATRVWDVRPKPGNGRSYPTLAG